MQYLEVMSGIGRIRQTSKMLMLMIDSEKQVSEKPDSVNLSISEMVVQ